MSSSESLTNQDETQNDNSDRLKTADMAGVSVQVLRARYPRFCECLQPSSMTKLSPRPRIVSWLLRLIEDIYDSAAENVLPSSVPLSIKASSSPETNSRPQELARSKLAMPFLAQRCIHHTLGLRELADQECLDLMYNIELRRQHFSQVALFSLFLRELNDSDVLILYLRVRLALQVGLDLNLASKEKQAHTSALGRKYSVETLVELRSHPLVPDGTKQVYLSAAACELVLESIFMATAQLCPRDNKRQVQPLLLAQYAVRVKLNLAFQGGECPEHILLEDFLSALVQEFQSVDEDILSMFKYNDDGENQLPCMSAYLLAFLTYYVVLLSTGESLASLIRLRDTIASEARIQAWTTSFSEQEKVLRNLKIEQIRMERNNGDNRFRVELRLLENRIHAQEQELVHIQSQISGAEGTVNDVWKDVLKRGRPPSDPMNPGSDAEKQLASVLGRFETHLARYYQKHAVKVKAAALISIPWQKQIDEYRLRVVVRLQRAYRARKRTRQTKEQAREKLQTRIREREIKQRNDQLEKQRMQALRDKEMERHQLRMQARQSQEAKRKAEQDAKQKQIVDRLHEEEAARLQVEHNRRLQTRMWSNWRRFVRAQRQKRKASAMFMRFTMLKWKRHFAEFKRMDAAARSIQSFIMRCRERSAFRKQLRHQVKRNKLAKKYLQKVQHRLIARIFNHWAVFADRQQTLRANFAQLTQKRENYWLQRWIAFVIESKATKQAAATLLQRQYRGRLARRLYQYCRNRNRKAIDIQRVYRGHRSRVRVKKLRQIKAHQDEGAAKILARINSRTMTITVAGFYCHAYIERRIREMARHRCVLRKRHGFGAFSLNVHRMKEKRAARLRQQHESATRIQRNYRRHRCQRIFRVAIPLHRAARTIQRVYRGHCGRQAASKRRWQVNAAVTIQMAWRRHRAMLVVAGLRAEKILLAAFRGDYSVVKRAIVSGYWYVADAGGNGILHMAAAANHKRIVKLCLRNSFDVNAANYQQQTPLHLVLANLPPSSRYSHEADPDEDDNLFGREERLALAEYMIDHGAWHEAADEHGLTPLLLCASLGHADAVELLLERGADTSARSNIGHLNAAQLAVEGSHHETLRVLLASRAFDYGDPTARDTTMLLHACAGRGLVDCLRVLVDHMQTRSDAECFPADALDLRDLEGYTPLIYAVSNGVVNGVSLLLERGAGPDVKDFFGRTPIHFALAFGGHDADEAAIAARNEMVRLLTMFEADVNVQDTDGDAPLHVSAHSDSMLACTTLLLASGALLGANAVGNHPTHVAAQRGAVATLRVLLEYGGDLNLKNYAGKTPLGEARMRGQLAVVRFILDCFANEEVDQADATTAAADGSSAGEVDNDEDGDGDEGELPERSSEEWAEAVAVSTRMDAVGGWTQFVDAVTGAPFYASGDGSSYSWEPPVEFDAALGVDWEVVRCPPGFQGVDHDGRRLATAATNGPTFLYHHRGTGELRATAPPVDTALLQDVVQRSKRHRVLRARVRRVAGHQGEPQAASASAVEYLRFARAFEAESAALRSELGAAVAIQRHFRAWRTMRLVRALLHQNRRAVDVQRAFRARRGRKLAARMRLEHASAARIQAAWRGLSTRRQEVQGGRRAQREQHLRRRRAALALQRAFRGFLGRRRAFRVRVERFLGPTTLEDWDALRRSAIVRREFKAWLELEAPRAFPAVRFYCHRVTLRCAWTQPAAWAVHDREAFEARRQLWLWGYTAATVAAATALQRQWRARAARQALRAVLHAVRLMRRCEREYLEDPASLVKLGNYALWLHAVRHDYDRARPLYARLLRAMAARGPDVPFVLWSCAVFGFVTREEDAAAVEELCQRAELRDPRRAAFQTALLGFFRPAALQRESQSAEALANYAAVLHWVYRRLDDAQRWYLEALALCPTPERRAAILELLQELLDRRRRLQRQQRPQRRAADPDGEFDGHEVFRRWQAEQAAAQDLARRQALEAQQDAEQREAAARMIQARYRRRRAARQVSRLQGELRVAAVRAEQARSRELYDRVARAVERVAGSRTAPALSVRAQQLPAVLQVLADGAEVDTAALAAAFVREHRGLRAVTVLDVVRLVENAPALLAAVEAGRR